MKTLAAVVMVSVLSVTTLYAQDARPRSPVSVAVLDYETKAPGNEDQGSQIADILTTYLSMDDGLVLVERANLGKILEEHKLKLVGLVNQDEAAQVGKLTGAQLLVVGKTFVMDKKLMVITKIVSVETGRVVGGLRQVELSKPLSESIALLAQDVPQMIRTHAEKLLPKDTQLPDPIEDIRKALGNRKPLVVAVVVPEEHIRRREPAPIPDPACETEIKKVLLRCGYQLVDTGENDLADWAKAMLKGDKRAWPAALNTADVVVVGEAFSEFALRTGDLVTCVGRAEVNVIDRHSGKILLADRDTSRAVDLAENIAGKTALQKTGHTLGIAVGKTLVDYKKAP